ELISERFPVSLQRFNNRGDCQRSDSIELFFSQLLGAILSLSNHLHPEAHWFALAKGFTGCPEQRQADRYHQPQTHCQSNRGSPTHVSWLLNSQERVKYNDQWVRASSPLPSPPEEEREKIRVVCETVSKSRKMTNRKCSVLNAQ